MTRELAPDVVASQHSDAEPTNSTARIDLTSSESAPRPAASVELFAGAGGLALGLQRAGFTPTAVVESDPRAAMTLRSNGSQLGAAGHDWPVVDTDVRQLDFASYQGIDLVSAGPPCQPFSVGGLRKGRQDHRDLMPEVIRAVREAQPKAFLIENVRGLTFERVRPYLDYCVEQLRIPSVVDLNQDEPAHLAELQRLPESDHEYRVEWRLLNAADFGHPQQRVRLVIVGVRSDLPQWIWPAATHSRRALLTALDGDEYWDEHGVDEAARKRGREAAQQSKTALRTLDSGNGERWNTVRDMLARMTPASVTSDDPHHRVVPGARLYKKHRGSNMDWPAKTVKAGVHGTPGGEHVVILDDGSHRYFTVRECATLQGFPCSYDLPELRSVALRQIGNAVPVGMAEILGRQLRELIT